MITKITDSLPIAGGAGGAICRITTLLDYFPTWETIISMLLYVTFGAVIGYLVKLFFDWIINSIKRGNLRKKKPD